MEEIIQILLDETKHYKALASVPLGRKEDVGYLVSDERNMERRVRGQRSRFQDDVGKWRYSLSPKLTYVMDQSGVRRVMKSDPGVYCVRSQVDGIQVWLPMTPQPSDESTVVELQRNYSTLARDSSYKRKVTWINACYPGPALTPAVAWYEYMGRWPDASGRGNAPTTEQPRAGGRRVPTETAPAGDDPDEAPLEAMEVSSESALSDAAEVGIPIPHRPANG
ncbi:uncharacterized protein LOC119109417 [Pollicipes pollicipes]|uniref:uncharacterized protein LOC119109417 n=1 Tax=Pollicipes pollicipes TaxID=41117 RepID=UPI001884DC1E|nr:uncharacterized protein LOC119109417 [Pollicipes pollicipes]